ncbi:MAG: hypothetical protein V2A54_15925 [Bacteroidota bacterium]
MKLLIFLCASFFVTASCSQSSVKDANNTTIIDTTFSFYLTESFHETSLDSHWYTSTYSIKNGVLSYDYVYGGFPAPEKKHKDTTLSEKDFISIKEKLKELKLFINYKKTFPVEKKGLIVETCNSLQINDADKIYKISISGGRPMDLVDEVGNRLSEFEYFVKQLLKL